MASEKQIQANQTNSKKSTGPKTAKGKAVSSKNAVRHGILSSETLLTWESAEALESMRQNMHDSLWPEGELEKILVERIVSVTWRLRRVARIETSLYTYKRVEFLSELFGSRIEDGVKIICSKAGVDADLANKFRRAVLETFFKTFPDHVDMGVVFEKNAEALANINRYENSLERSLFKTLHELQRLQSVRAGRHVPAPIALDIQSDS
jgi:hypothetical protein